MNRYTASGLAIASEVVDTLSDASVALDIDPDVFANIVEQVWWGTSIPLSGTRREYIIIRRLILGVK